MNISPASDRLILLYENPQVAAADGEPEVGGSDRSSEGITSGAFSTYHEGGKGCPTVAMHFVCGLAAVVLRQYAWPS